MEETLHCDNKGKPKECSILQHSVSQSESYYEPPTMFATESHNETASVEHEERREAAHCSVSTTTEDNDIHTNTCLSEYDVISSLQLSTDPLPNMLPMKLILLGSSGVGKTSLIMRFLQKCFWQAQTTIAVDHNHCFVSHLSKHVNISLTLFDTAGQERFDSICASYYRDADAVLMVFDMTDQDSLDDVGNRWVKQMKDHMSSTDIPVLLVGNKCECHLHISRGIRTQAKEMVRQFDFAEFMEASAKDGQKVEVIFEKILSLAVTRLLKLRGFTESENDNVITLDPPTFITPRRKCC
ncbi:ras-related protein Rab-12-like isoform X2 [Dysidea avara]|uniref:ras-related protein Rab-12-like isoform X2 n=1 Tax=Dysidea avara TaxID=196820 RepID=UPI003333DA81